jgi:hypothetical protein
VFCSFNRYNLDSKYEIQHNNKDLSFNILARKQITDISKEYQGADVALTLPKNDESQIHEKDFDQLNGMN